MAAKRARLEIAEEPSNLPALASLLLKMDLVLGIKAEMIKEAFYSPRDKIIRS